MTSKHELDSHDGSERVFRYRVARHSWIMLCVLLAGGALVIGSALTVGGGWQVFDDEIVLSIGIVMVILGLVMLPAPILDIVSARRSRLVVTRKGLSWRGLGASKSFPWDQIIAIGVPPEDPRRVDDRRFHVLLEEDYDFIQGYNLDGREEVASLMQSWGGFSEGVEVGSHSFMCRRERSDETLERARIHLLPSDDDPWDFWSTRFRRI